jgi:hypothetical protein
VGTHPKNRPFIIHTPHADAEVLGTKFSLDVDAERTRLDVFESRVRLRMAGEKDGVVVDAGFGAEARPGTAIVASRTNADGNVAVFQDGRDGYAGTRSVAITTQVAEFTNNNGKTQFDDDFLLVCNFKDYQKRVLLRFDGLSLPPMAKVESAELDLKFENWETGGSLAAAYMNVSWNPMAREMDGLGWLHRDAGVDWAAPGAGDEKKDRIPGVSIAIPKVGDGYEVASTIPLDKTQVQRWIDAPATNHGVIFYMTQRGDQTRLFVERAPEQRRRPALVIHYSLPTPVKK